ncbi:unnamed protein product [Mytilus coruscus]|uniref:C1q domain-containing protein n=1 Tax=Mytilus coruscus TaxID=42192 RepID=A0A6J8EUT7_MYTCO|nr:unnamed protein product [Mytilus coruscus]
MTTVKGDCNRKLGCDTVTIENTDLKYSINVDTYIANTFSALHISPLIVENDLFDDLIQMMLKIKGSESLGQRKGFLAFTAYRASPQSLSANEVVKFDKVWTNNGDGYDPSSGVFTAPKAGLYHFAAVVMSANGKFLFLRLYHNNAKITSSYVNDKRYKTGTFDVVLTLVNGDKVSIKSGGNNQSIYSDSEYYSTFSGNLIAM